MNLVEREYFNHFNFVVIICPTSEHNETYKSREWFKADAEVFPIEPDNCLYEWIKKLGNNLAVSKTLFLIDDLNADESLNKRRNPLLRLAISGRHEGYSLWLLSQSHTAVLLNIRRQAKMLYVWYPKKRGDWDTIHEEIEAIETLEELANVEKQLKQGKHTCLVMRNEHPRAYEIHWVL